MSFRANLATFKIVGLYLVLGVLWILWSDSLLASLVPPQQISTFQTYKGWFFIFVTASFLFILLRNQFTRIEGEMRERRQAEAQAHSLSRTLRVLSQVNQSLVRDRGGLVLFDSVCKIAVEDGGYSLALVVEVSWESHLLGEMTYCGEVGESPEEFQKVLQETFTLNLEETRKVQLGSPRVVENLLEKPELHRLGAFAKRLDLQSMGVFPIPVFGETRALLVLFSREPRFFDTTEVSLLAELAGDLGFALEYAEKERQKQEAVETLRKAEWKYRQLFATNPLPAYVFDQDTLRILAVNKVMVRKYGYSEEEFLSMTIRDIRPVEDSPEIERVLGEIRRDPEHSHSGEWRHVLKDGTVIQVEVTSHPIEYDDLPARLVLVNDITARLNAENDLRQTTHLLETLIDSSPLAITQLDTDGNIRFINTAAEDMFGWTLEECIGKPPPSVPAESLGEFHALFGSALSRQTFRNLQTRRVRKDGSPIDVSISGGPILDGSGRVIGAISVILDTSDWMAAQRERDEIEKEFRQAQKMEAVGRLAGGVAHDFNNMLNVILGYTDLLIASVAVGEETYEELVAIRKAAMHSADLTRQLLAFSRKQVARPLVVNLNSSIASQAKIIARLIGEDISYEFLPGEDLWNVRIDPSQVDQIMANLSVNARDAIKGTGSVVIRTENAHLKEDLAGLFEARPGDYVLLSFSDTGVGMDQATLEKAFEPFFTTKREGEGTGLGLSTVYGIVQQNNGVIHIYSEPGLGTTFKIYFPKYEAEDEAIEGVHQGDSLFGSETLLVVEDEPQLLELSKRMLDRYGYHVLTAQTPQEAIKIAEDRQGQIDLLLTDVVMPSMNGKELENALRGRYPNLKTLFMSGYTADLIAKKGILEEGVDLILKPFSHQDLAARVRSILERP